LALSLGCLSGHLIYGLVGGYEILLLAPGLVKISKLVPESLSHGERLDLMILPPFELVPCGVIL